MKISIVVASGENNAIGLKGNLLWKLPKDLEYFKRLTTGHHVLMGRKSWESLPLKFRPLPERANIVVTRQKDFIAHGAKVVATLKEGIEFAKSNGETELMVIGGGEIYKQALDQTHKIYITRVHHRFENADTFFPEIKENEWKIVSRELHKADEKHTYDFEFVVMERLHNEE